MNPLSAYFQDGLEKPGRSIGTEIETSFVRNGKAATLSETQSMLKILVERGWQPSAYRGKYLTAITDQYGNRVLYELGRQNLELAARPATAGTVVREAKHLLDELYSAAGQYGLEPNFKPRIESEEDLLLIADERDAAWLELDGRQALALLAGISAEQFTVEVPFDRAILCLNRLGKVAWRFLEYYPQDRIWRQYIQQSHAGYRCDRYGGPLQFTGLRAYCQALALHDVVQDGKLVPFYQAKEIDLPLFIRSVWWYFRLKRYGNRLCIEVRPLARRSDERLEQQLQLVLETLNL